MALNQGDAAYLRACLPEVLKDLQKARPRMQLVGAHIDDSAVVRSACEGKGWDDCVARLESLAIVNMAAQEIGGYREVNDELVPKKLETATENKEKK